MRKLGLITAVTVVGLAGFGCGDECDERLAVELPAGQTDGSYVFSGTADGTPFRCEYVVSIEGGEVVTATSRGCEGPVSLDIEHHHFEIGVAASVTGVIAPPPDSVEYRVELTDYTGADPIVESEGTVEPDYGSGCRQATIDAV